MKITLVQFFNLIREIYGPKLEQLRLGQHAFLCLHRLNRTIADSVMENIDADPFDVDSRLDAMLIFILKNYVEDYK